MEHKPEHVGIIVSIYPILGRNGASFAELTADNSSVT